MQVLGPQLLHDQKLESAILLGTKPERHCNSLHLNFPVFACQVLETAFAGLPRTAYQLDAPNDSVYCRPQSRAQGLCYCSKT